jgi:hypothetical protein
MPACVHREDPAAAGKRDFRCELDSMVPIPVDQLGALVAGLSEQSQLIVAALDGLPPQA